MSVSLQAASIRYHARAYLPIRYWNRSFTVWGQPGRWDLDLVYLRFMWAALTSPKPPTQVGQDPWDRSVTRRVFPLGVPVPVT